MLLISQTFLSLVVWDCPSAGDHALDRRPIEVVLSNDIRRSGTNLLCGEAPGFNQAYDCHLADAQVCRCLM